MLTLGGVVCFVGAVLALWLVREREIEREPADSVEPVGQVGPQGAEAPAG